MKVTKMQGCGNDFVVVEEAECEGWKLNELAFMLCDRHFGIGADGLILVKRNPLEFVYHNSDGSFSPFCGNGMRCFARYCIDHQIVSSNEFDVICMEWKIHCVVDEQDVTVEIPEIQEEEDTHIIKVCGSRHVVIEDRELNVNQVAQSEFYNINLVQIMNQSEIKIKTVERGAGLTLACGSGSIASAYRCYQEKKTNHIIKVYNPGGVVEIDIKNMKMKGMAKEVFQCEINENALK